MRLRVTAATQSMCCCRWSRGVDSASPSLSVCCTSSRQEELCGEDVPEQLSFQDSMGLQVTEWNKVVAVWRKQTDGSWKNVIDIWNADPTAWR
jgi:hypothetical protein